MHDRIYCGKEEETNDRSSSGINAFATLLYVVYVREKEEKEEEEKTREEHNPSIGQKPCLCRCVERRRRTSQRKAKGKENKCRETVRYFS
jgi:hypothetical protein